MIVSKLEYYIGRPVTKIHKEKDQSQGTWAIELAGNVFVKNYDKRRAAPTGIEGLGFVKVEYLDEHTVLKFSAAKPGAGSGLLTTVNLTPTQYSISGSLAGEVEVYPQRKGEVVDCLPPDPSPERVAEGPVEASESGSEATETSEGSE